VRHYDSRHDRTFNCAILYINESNRRTQANVKVIAPAADLALELAEKIIRTDGRRKVREIVYMEAIEQ
jgi:hypothetical protein